MFAGTAQGTGAPGSVTKFVLGAKDGFNSALLERVNWWPQTQWAVTSIGAVTGPVSPLGGPDTASIPPSWGETLIYASMRDSTQIYLNFGNKDFYIPGAWLGTLHRHHGGSELPVVRLLTQEPTRLPVAEGDGQPPQRHPLPPPPALRPASVRRDAGESDVGRRRAKGDVGPADRALPFGVLYAVGTWGADVSGWVRLMRSHRARPTSATKPTAHAG